MPSPGMSKAKEDEIHWPDKGQIVLNWLVCKSKSSSGPLLISLNCLVPGEAVSSQPEEYLGMSKLYNNTEKINL